MFIHCKLLPYFEVYLPFLYHFWETSHFHETKFLVKYKFKFCVFEHQLNSRSTKVSIIEKILNFFLFLFFRSSIIESLPSESSGERGYLSTFRWRDRVFRSYLTWWHVLLVCYCHHSFFFHYTRVYAKLKHTHIQVYAVRSTHLRIEKSGLKCFLTSTYTG